MRHREQSGMTPEQHTRKRVKFRDVMVVVVVVWLGCGVHGARQRDKLRRGITSDPFVTIDRC